MQLYNYKLVKLPRIKGIDKDFYGIGYFSENGEFIFSLIRPEMPCQPRSIHPKEWGSQNYESEIEIIGDIEKLR